jgi:PD-(D/E)XK nuclease superfamily protein
MSRIRGTPRGRDPASEESPVKSAGVPRGGAGSLQGELGEVAFMHKATSLGFALALPYGHLHRYDFIVESGRNLWRVQVKTSNFMKGGLYRLCIYNCTNQPGHAYTVSEIDFVAVLIVPEGSWYILPVREVLERQIMLFRPKGYPRSDPYAYYREAWHLLREPDGLTFG